jgi:predicted  nucleic acid-binding Zn-ribbon protein
MARKTGGRKASSRKLPDRTASSRKPRVRKTRSSEELEKLRTEIRTALSRIDQIERRLDETDHATKGAISRLRQMTGELNVRLTSVAANVFEVIAMATKTPVGSEQKPRPPAKLDGKIKL